MRPDESDFTDEIRGHLAIDIKQRIDRGEDPVSARREALKEFGYLPAVRDEMRRVWYSRWYDQAEALARDDILPATRRDHPDAGWRSYGVAVGNA